MQWATLEGNSPFGSPQSVHGQRCNPSQAGPPSGWFGHPDGLLGLLTQNQGLDEGVLVSVELRTDVPVVDWLVLTALLSTLLLVLLPVVVVLWSLVPPWFGLQPARASAANKTRIDFFIVVSLDL